MKLSIIHKAGIAVLATVLALVAADFYLKHQSKQDQIAEAGRLKTECVQAKVAELLAQGQTKSTAGMLVPMLAQTCIHELIATGDLVYLD